MADGAGDVRLFVGRQVDVVVAILLAVVQAHGQGRHDRVLHRVPSHQLGGRELPVDGFARVFFVLPFQAELDDRAQEILLLASSQL